MLEQYSSSQISKRIRSRSMVEYVALLTVPLVVMITLGVVAYRAGSNSADRLIRDNLVHAAVVTRELVEQEFQLRMNGLSAVANTPGLVEAAASGDVEGVRRRLKAVVDSDDRVMRAFVTDPSGVLWSDYPAAPETIGVDFSYREWYHGVSRNWEPYVSPVYERSAAPQLLLVGVAVPLRAADGEVLGALVYQLQLEKLAALLSEVRVGETGFVVLLDPRGRVAAHPQVDLQDGLHEEYAAIERIWKEDADETGSFEYVDPLSKVPMLATVIPFEICGDRWRILAQQPQHHAYRPLQALRLQIGGAGALLSVFMALFAVVLARSDARTRRLVQHIAALNETLSRENREKQAAQDALGELNAQLEQRVERRTRELKEMEGQLFQSQKMEAIGRLAGGVAHDFNNLLTVMGGYASILASDPRFDSDTRAALEEIRIAVERATALTRQLLAFSRRQVLQPVVLDVNAAVAGMDKMLRRLIGEDIDLVTNLEPDLHPVKFDAGQLDQIVMNLAVNARDAMPDGGKLTIATRNAELDDEYARTHAGAQVGPHVEIAITDTGCGMTPETQARIFEPFFTTKEAGRGTGLGLSTVYGIVKQSGGNIWVYSEPGRGSVFKIYLPRAEDTSEPATVAAYDESGTGGSETLLVVEDDNAVRSLVRRVLSQGGYTVLEADSPAVALEVCRAHAGAIDLMLTDVVMPGMNIREFTEAVRALRPGIAVVYMSGYTDDAIIHQGVLEDGMAFIEKPIIPEALLRKIRRYLRRPEAPVDAADRPENRGDSHSGGLT